MKFILILIIGVAAIGFVFLGTALGAMVADDIFPVKSEYSIETVHGVSGWGHSPPKITANINGLETYCIVDVSFSSRSACDAIQIYQNDIIIKQNERIIKLLENRNE